VHRGIGKPLRDPSPITFIGKLLADLGQVVLAVRILDVGPELGPFAREMHPAPEHVSGGTPLSRIDRGLREHAAAEQHGNLVGVDPIVLGLAPMNGFHVKGMAQDEGNTRLGAKVGEPVPGEDAFDADHEILSIGRNRLEKRLGCCPHIPVEQDLSLLVQDTEVHGAGV
jgi:hypothetical protein